VLISGQKHFAEKAQISLLVSFFFGCGLYALAISEEIA